MDEWNKMLLMMAATIAAGYRAAEGSITSNSKDSNFATPEEVALWSVSDARAIMKQVPFTVGPFEDI
jgi:hypothetical protein